MANSAIPVSLIEAGPVPGAERLSSLDSLRGVAVLGILVMNIYAFAMPFIGYSNPLAYGGLETHNVATWFVTHVFFDQKFMSIFSMLFGAGIVLMMDRAAAKGASFGRIFLRRQLWLLVIGLIHAYLIWFGDILFFYAVVGLLAFFFRKLAPRALLAWGLLLLLAGMLFMLAGSAYMADLKVQADGFLAEQAAGQPLNDEQQAVVDEWNETAGFISPTPEAIQQELETYRGGYTGIVKYRAPEVFQMQLEALPFFIIWRVGGLMLLGMALMKLDVLSARREMHYYRRMVLLGYGLGLPLAILSAANAYTHDFDSLYMLGWGGMPNYIGSLLVAGGHIGVVMMLVKSGSWRTLMTRFAAVGRTALSNYLVHSLVMTSLFYGYGLGLYGEIPRFWQMAFVAGLLGLQLFLSPWWIARYRFGPAEWLWRSLTYWQRQPMRRNF
ncbi:MAG TPA: DUF418 domain-containing protein [Woeseiaceae bacterium]|nr:DUF418 domain-containing protein [Woeseiaceae bacterium]